MNLVILALLDGILFGYVFFGPTEDTTLDAQMVEQVQNHCIPAGDLENLQRSLEKGGSK